MRRFLPKKYEWIAFGLLLSGLMSLLVSGISTLMAAGIGPQFPAAWMGAWSFSWAVAFPAVLVVAPLVRLILARFVIDEPNARKES